MIFRFPDYVLGSIAMNWIDFVELRALDTAICNEIDRIRFLWMLSASWFKFEPHVLLPVKCISWMCARKICLQHVTVSLKFCDRNLLTEGMSQKQLWTRLRTFHCTVSKKLINNHGYFDDMWECLVNNNPMLTNLEVCEIEEPDYFLNLVADKLSHLVNLRIWTCGHCKSYLHHTLPVLLKCRTIQNIAVMAGNCRCFHHDDSTIIVQVNEHRELHISLEWIIYFSVESFQYDMDMLANFKLIGFSARKMHYATGICIEGDPIWITMLQNVHTLLELTIPYATFDEIKKLMSNNQDLLKLVVTFKGHSPTQSEVHYRTLFINTTHKLVSLRLDHIHKHCYMSDNTANDILAACPQLREFAFDVLKGAKLIRKSVVVYPRDQIHRTNCCGDLSVD